MDGRSSTTTPRRRTNVNAATNDLSATDSSPPVAIPSRAIYATRNLLWRLPEIVKSRGARIRPGGSIDLISGVCRARGLHGALGSQPARRGRPELHYFFTRTCTRVPSGRLPPVNSILPSRTTPSNSCGGTTCAGGADLTTLRPIPRSIASFARRSAS